MGVATARDVAIGSGGRRREDSADGKRNGRKMQVGPSFLWVAENRVVQ